MFQKFIFLIFKGVRYRPVRSWLTILGIVIGVMLVVIVLSLGDGIQNAVKSTLQMFGSDIIYVFPGKDTNPIVSFIGGERFKEKDLLALEEIPGVKFVAVEDIMTMNVEFKGEKKSTMVHSVVWKWMRELLEESEGIKLAQGQWPDHEDSTEVILGSRTANGLFMNVVGVGDEIIIKGKRMKVAGIISPIGEQMSDNIIFIPLSVFQDLTGLKSTTRSANVKVFPGTDTNLVAKQIRFELSKQDVVRDFSVLTPEKTERIAGSILSIIELILVIIALISLIVGAVGIMNTMYTSVLERTKQIGIMKAIGASNDSILTLFLIESGIIGLLGGILGIIFGILSAYGIGLAAASSGVRGLFSFASLDFFGLFVVLFLTFVVGVVSGVLPAKQAARMEPAEALRYE